MKINLRNYQVKLINDIYSSWNEGHKNVLAVSPTGSGKAFTLCTLAEQLAYTHGLPTMIQVHRIELVAQLCMSLGKLGVVHNIIAQPDTVSDIIEQQRAEYNQSYYNPKAPITVASVDTLRSRVNNKKYKLNTERVCNETKVWILDEAAHQLKANKWGKVIDLLPNAIGVGFTATPQRLDRKGLGRHAFGLFDTMVQGPTVRYLIEQGYLSKYKIVVPASDYSKYLKDKGDDKVDYSVEDREYASMHSQITGDVVKNYLKFAKGKQTIVFADSIKAAKLMEDNFRQAGVTAKLVTGSTPAGERRKAISDFANNVIQVLLNVDLFDEGFDLLTVEGKRIIECVIMARISKSLSKVLQMIGRGIRPVYSKGFDLSTVEGRHSAQANSYKPHAIIIDHVGNVKYHGLPDNIRKWTLDNIVKKRESVNLLKICGNIECNSPFDRALTECPFCGHAAHSSIRRGGERDPVEELKMVDGDLALLDPETIRQFEKQTELEDPNHLFDRIFHTAGKDAAGFHKKKQLERIETQKNLAHSIARWMGVQKDRYGYTNRQLNKRFYIVFGETPTVALSQPRVDMLKYINEIEESMWV